MIEVGRNMADLGTPALMLVMGVAIGLGALFRVWAAGS